MMNSYDDHHTSEQITAEQTLNLARGLVGLQTRTLEYCTPGHRMGHSYQLLIAALIEAVAPVTADGPSICGIAPCGTMPTTESSSTS